MVRKKVVAIVITSVLVIGLVLTLLTRKEEVIAPQYEELPTSPFYIIASYPKNEYERVFVASLSTVAVSNSTYNPMFLANENGLDAHTLSTIANMSSITHALVFANDSAVCARIREQLQGINITFYNVSFSVIARLGKNSGLLPVSSYREAIWAAPIAAVKNMRIVYVPGKCTYTTQADAWNELSALGVNATYALVTNALDYMPRVGGKNKTCAADIASGVFDKWHIPAISFVAAEIAAYHRAYVITDVTPCDQPIGDMDGETNSYALGIHSILRNISQNYGPLEYVCLVGSGSAVPQFILKDYTDDEGKATVASDVIYGFVDDNPYDMDVAVGRIINYNVFGAFNMVARTFGHDYFKDTVKMKNSNGDVKEVNWRTHGSAWNGYHVVDIRRQFSPGYFLTRDFEDEGYTYEYVTTRGIARDRNEYDIEWEFEPILGTSGIVAYRGHGSATGSFYMWGHNLPTNKDTHLSAEDARKLYLPPQVFVSVCCLNGYIWGKDFKGGNEVNRTFSISYLYAGCIGLFGATEVSYSNLGQDKYALLGEITGDHNWDKNNAIYAFIVDGLLNHEEEHGTLGRALQWCVNRYIKDHGGNISPLYHEGDPVDWKECTVFSLYGDPAFRFWQPRPGSNNYDPWHNGDDDCCNFKLTLL